MAGRLRKDPSAVFLVPADKLLKSQVSVLSKADMKVPWIIQVPSRYSQFSFRFCLWLFPLQAPHEIIAISLDSFATCLRFGTLSSNHCSCCLFTSMFVNNHILTVTTSKQQCMSTCRHDSMLKVQPTSGLTHSIQIHLMLCMDVEILLGIIFFPSLHSSQPKFAF